ADDGPFAAAHARAQAKKHAVRAAQDYQAGRYLPALEGYTHAYDLSPLPEVLFNIGQCHFQLSSWERAIFFYRAYLHDRPDAANRALVEQLIAEAEFERDRSEAARAMPLPAEPARREAELEAANRPPVYRRWWFWAAVGTAAVAGSAALYFMEDAPEGGKAGKGLGVPLLSW
ncbi:MAG TPA: hypothetical protein VMZ28_28505, partial [Kofleriaceae bacterium]|nr:hypothetical protein [Kofleriaceae bacterium]